MNPAELVIGFAKRGPIALDSPYEENPMAIQNVRNLGAQSIGGVSAASSGAASGLSSGQLAQLKESNPRIETLLKENPGLGAFLAKNSVSGGPGPNDARTEVTWSFWTHSEKTNGKYGHGMKDAQILSDYIVVIQPSKDPKANVRLGYNSFAGHEIIGVFKTGDHVPRPSSAYDGGHLGEFDVVGHGTKGEQVTMGWAIMSIDGGGNVKGGGYPTTRGGKMVPYQEQKGAGGGGGEYWGRAARVEHGRTNNWVPITEN